MTETAPEWLLEEIRRAKRGKRSGPFRRTNGVVNGLKLPTVCESARCPNRGECFSNGTATFLILGNACTRSCAFCAIPHDHSPPAPDDGEPERLARAVATLSLSHAVITSVTRDDLTDGGAAHFARVVTAIRSHCPGVTVELLVPDFRGEGASLLTVLNSQPHVLAHNIETVPRLYETVRMGADYRRSLRLLENAKRLAPGVVTKSGIMLGLGERSDEVDEVLRELAATGCELLTIGQYLAPSLASAPVRRYLDAEEFDRWRDRALNMGFRLVVSGPLVRSSYRASRFMEALR